MIEILQHSWQEEQQRRHKFRTDADEGQKVEFIQGEPVYHSPIYGRPWMISTHICRYLIPYVYDRTLGKVAYEKVMLRLFRNDYEPDICFWRHEKAKDFGLKQSAFPPPDFIVEILSESTKERDRGIKFQDYALHGVEEYWIVDPASSTIEQYLLSKQTYNLALKLKSGVIVSTVIEGFQLEVEKLFYYE